MRQEALRKLSRGKVAVKVKPILANFRKMRLTGNHSKTNASEILGRCNSDQSDVVLHDVPIFKPLRRLVFKLCLFLAFRAKSR